MAAFFSRLVAIFRLFAPGVFADREHWRERALNAEARLSELIAQLDASLQREREEWRSERTELLGLGRMRGDNPLPLPPSNDDRNGEGGLSVPRSHPIARAYAAARAKEREMPDDLVEQVVDDILRMNAASTSNNHDRGQ